MSVKKPIVNNNGQLEQLQAGDNIIPFGETTVTFDGLSASVTVTILDENVLTTSVIILQITVGSDRDLDEMEMEAFQLAYGNKINATSFDIIVTQLNGGAEGDYKINYQILN